MGEYALYHDNEIKIGTCEDMYYLRYKDREQVTPLSGNVDAVADAADLRFRFPWPDEDSIKPGGYDAGYRTVTIPGLGVPAGVDHGNVQFCASAGYLLSLPCPESGAYTDKGLVRYCHEKDIRVARNGCRGAALLVAQRWVDGILAPVFECGGCRAMWRVQDPSEIEHIAVLLRSEADRRTRSGENGEFLHAVADRMLADADTREDACTPA